MSKVYFCFLSITEWNPDTIPKFAMVDFDNAEIISLERVFPTIKIFLCDFYREQAWHRYHCYLLLKGRIIDLYQPCICLTNHLILYTYIY